MASRFEDEARRKFVQQDGFRQWLTGRIEVIHATVSSADILRRNGVRLRYDGKRPEQIFCPFHGNTKTPAARFHPPDARKPDHVWCFVCNQQWDAITLYKKFENYEGKFSGLLRHIEREYGITPPEAPEVGEEPPDESELIEVTMLLDVCERRLRDGRHAFDMRGYLILGAILDKLSHGIEAGTQSLPRAKETMQRVLDKIGQKVRACPDG